MSRVALEALLGIRLENGKAIRVKPCIPDDWPGFTVHLRLPRDETRLTIRASNPNGVAHAVTSATLDGRAVEVRDGEARAPLPQGGDEHELQVVLGRRIGTVP
jgi:cyclic beta-1,2-glucan synthetase